MTLMLAILWLPATAHCRLEMVSGLEFFSCCDHQESRPTPIHHDEHCDSDGCAVVESCLYKQETFVAAPERPLVAPAGLDLAARTGQPSSASLLPNRNVSAPPELSRIWQFLFRTASLPRAPSVIS